MRPLVSIFSRRIIVVIGAVIAIAGPATALDAQLVLITADEAKLPPPKDVSDPSRAITRGPKIEVAMPPGSHSPIALKVVFKTYGGSTIDLSSVQATYLRTPNVDLTARIKPFVSSTGIDLKDAELPPGDHIIRIDLKDSDGRIAKTNVSVKIDR